MQPTAFRNIIDRDVIAALELCGIPLTNGILRLKAAERHRQPMLLPSRQKRRRASCTQTISSAEAERSFSLMKRIKTCTRSAMCEERFPDLAIIAVHYPERFEVDEVCREITNNYFWYCSLSIMHFYFWVSCWKIR